MGVYVGAPVVYYVIALDLETDSSAVAGVAFFIAKANYLPRLQYDKMFRWDYDYTEIGDAPAGYSYGLADLDADFHNPGADSDEWTVGSSSSVSSGSISPIEDGQSLWEGETLASHSDSEQSR